MAGKDAIESKGRVRTRPRNAGSINENVRVAMMRVFTDKCVVMVVEIAKAKKETRRAEFGPVNGMGQLRAPVRS